MKELMFTSMVRWLDSNLPKTPWRSSIGFLNDLVGVCGLLDGVCLVGMLPETLREKISFTWFFLFVCF